MRARGQSNRYPLGTIPARYRLFPRVVAPAGSKWLGVNRRDQAAKRGGE